MHKSPYLCSSRKSCDHTISVFLGQILQTIQNKAELHHECEIFVHCKDKMIAHPETTSMECKAKQKTNWELDPRCCNVKTTLLLENYAVRVSMNASDIVKTSWKSKITMNKLYTNWSKKRNDKSNRMMTTTLQTSFRHDIDMIRTLFRHHSDIFRHH